MRRNSGTMPKRIDKLSLAGFRGASTGVDLHFDPAKPIVLIFGENGTGKSSIIDGIDFVCNKAYGSIEDRSGTTPREHIVALKSASKDLRVTLHSNGQAWVGTLAKGSPSVSGMGDPPRARILRRSQILKVINDRPADRYRVVQPFIALPGIESAEQSLRDCLKSLNDGLEETARAKVQAEKSLSDSWIAEGRPGADFLPWAKAQAQGDPATLKAGAAHAKELLATLEKAQAAVDSLVASVKSRIDTESAFQKAEQAVKDLDQAAQESALIDLLKEAQKYLQKASQPDTCPLCERPGITVASLLARIAERLSAMQRTILLKNELDKARKSHENAAAVAAKDRANLIQSVRALAEALSKSKSPEVASVKLDWSQYPNMLAAEAPVVSDDVVREAQKLQLAAKACLGPLRTKYDADTRAFNQLGMLQRSVAALEDNTKKAVDLEKCIKRAQAILDVIEKHRKAFVEGILADISKEVGNLCEKIHPGEGIKVRFFLDPKKRGSLESLGEFAGEKDVLPQAYYSESHLDTLGVCVFLALTKRFRDENTVVVLDDVVTSIDAPHMDRFMGLLLDEAAHFCQLIVATHYRPWLEQFRHARGPSAKIELIHLAPWTLARGIRPGGAKLAVQELRAAVEAVPFDRQVVASKAGIILESLLDQLALLYECKVARKPEPIYTLGELLACVGKKLRPALKCVTNVAGGPPKEAPIGPMLDSVAAFAWIRNQVGAHWNPSGFNVPDADVLKFAQKTIGLTDALICAKCGSLPTKNKTGSHWQCRCSGETGLKLTPLENPDN